MQAYQERVIAEKAELDEKLEKINTMRAERGQAELDFAAFDKEYEDVAAAI